VYTLNVIPGQLSLAQLRDVYRQPVKLTLDHSASPCAASHKSWAPA
jgi:histidine ammonia-lyase